MKRCRIGTRGSKLALAQAEIAAGRLKSAFTDSEFELKIIKTKADRFSDTPLGRIEGEGLFIKEIEDSLLKDEIDLGVHSLKDMPLDIKEGLIIAAVLKRDDPRDALVCKDNKTLFKLARGAKIGTSSLRRLSQIKKARPDLNIEPLRGNIDTRLKRIANGELDAIIISACGLERLGLENRISEYLDFNVMLPCVGQGVIAVEARQEDARLIQKLAVINDEDTLLEIQAERGLLRRLGGGCRTPVGAIGRVKDDTLTLKGIVLSPDGSKFVQSEVSGKKQDADNIGTKLADTLIKMGANALLRTNE